MNMLGKLVLAGVLTMVSVPAMAHDRHHGRGRHHDRGHQHHDRCEHRVQARGPVWVAPAPVRREVWVPGHWSRRSHGNIWIEAGWVMPQQPAWVWVGPQWVRSGAGWQWQEGHWTSRS